MSEKNIKISMILPTRGRKQRALRFLESLVMTADAISEIEIILLVDEDDLESQSLNFEKIETQLLICRRQKMGFYNHFGALHARGDIIMLCNDDVVVETKGWDRKIKSVHQMFSDQVYLAYPNDGFKGGSLCTFPIFSKNSFRLAEGLLPTEYKGSFIDYHMMDIFKRLEKLGVSRLIYLKDIVFSHHHFRTGRGSFDQTYADRDRFGDDQIFLSLSEKRQEVSALFFAHIAQLHTPAEIVKQNQHRSTSGSLLWDRNLPFGWKIRLFSFMSVRQIFKVLFG